VEAFASGVPVLSSRVGGIAEQVNDKRGILVEVKNEKEFINGMEQMMKEVAANKFKKEDLHKYADDNFSYKKVGDHFHRIYLKILSEA
jgi:glycosyltransferase involved in cell wall biosynthesis